MTRYLESGQILIVSSVPCVGAAEVADVVDKIDNGWLRKTAQEPQSKPKIVTRSPCNLPGRRKNT